MSPITSMFSSPKVSSAPIAAMDEEKKKAKAARASLFATEGQVAGQEIGTGGVSKRDTIFGN